MLHEVRRLGVPRWSHSAKYVFPESDERRVQCARQMAFAKLFCLSLLLAFEDSFEYRVTKETKKLIHHIGFDDKAHLHDLTNNITEPAQLSSSMAAQQIFANSELQKFNGTMDSMIWSHELRQTLQESLRRIKITFQGVGHEFMLVPVPPGYWDLMITRYVHDEGAIILWIYLQKHSGSIKLSLVFEGSIEGYDSDLMNLAKFENTTDFLSEFLGHEFKLTNDHYQSLTVLVTKLD